MNKKLRLKGMSLFMKRAFSLLLSLLMAFSLTACGGNGNSSSSQASSSAPESSAVESTSSASEPSSSPESEAPSEALSSSEVSSEASAEDTNSGSSVLVVYYSATGNTAQAAQFCFHAAILGVAEVDNRFHQLHVLGKREMTAVDHRAAHACVDFTANIIQRFVVIKMQCQWHVIGHGIGATQGVDLFQRDMLKGPRRPGEDHRRSHFTAHFEDRLDRLGVMNVKSRHRVAIGLGVL